VEPSEEPRSIYCHGEAGEFPLEQFLRRDGRLLIPHIHDVGRPHYALTGEPAPREEGGVVKERIPDVYGDRVAERPPNS